MKNINWKRPTTLMVLLFIIALLFFLSSESKAETAVEAVPGVTWVGGTKYTGAGVMLTERWSEKYDLGIVLMTSQQCGGCRRGDYWGNLGVHALRSVRLGWAELGVGVAYWANQTPAWNSNTTFALAAAVVHGPWELRWRHYSTGGSSLKNSGLDMVTLGYRFGGAK